MKVKEIRERSDDELRKQLGDLEEQLFKLRFQKSTGQIENPQKMREVRKDMARVLLPWLPIGGLVRTQYDSMAKIREVRVPLLVLHGDRDDIVPFEHGRRLFEAANEPKTFYAIRGAHHNDTFVAGGRAYFDVWARFLNGL